MVDQRTHGGITDLMLRNLADVFGEGDPARRRAAIAELWTGRRLLRT
jgi:hypothetical protein